MRNLRSPTSTTLLFEPCLLDELALFSNLPDLDLECECLDLDLFFLQLANWIALLYSSNLSFLAWRI